jgi:hypothetical protein
MVSDSEDIIWLGITGDSPGILIRATGDITANMLRILVRIRINDYIIKIKILAGFHDPNGNFASIGYKNLSLQTVPRLSQIENEVTEVSSLSCTYTNQTVAIVLKSTLL